MTHATKKSHAQRKRPAQLQREIIEVLSQPKAAPSKRWPLKVYRVSMRVPSGTRGWDLTFDIPADSVRAARKLANNILHKSPHYTKEDRRKRAAFGSIEYAHDASFPTKTKRSEGRAQLLKEAHEAVGAA